MSSRKSATLLMEHYDLTQKGHKVLVLKPRLDTRDGNYIGSRAINRNIKAQMIGERELNKIIHLTTNDKPDYILFDEVNFATKCHVEELRIAATHYNIEVICYGLLTDFQTNLFDGSKRLIEISDEVEFMKSSCADANCKNDSNINMRLLDGKPTFHGDQIQIGGNESYKTVCYNCYEKYRREYSGK